MTSFNVASRFKAIAISATIALTLAACAGGSTQSPATNAETGDSLRAGGDLVFAIAGGNLENAHMDPHSSQMDVSGYVNRNIYDSLVALDTDGTVKPWLAKSWEISKDSLTYTFELRDDVTFHDGTPLNADAVVKNFDHIAAKETASAQALELIGGELFEGATALSEYQVQLTLKAPFAPLLTNISSTYVGMYSPKVLESATQADIRAGGPKVSVGSGPFILTQYTPKQHLVFAPNPAYSWGPDIATEAGTSLADGPAKLDSLTIRIVPEESARVGALQSGQAQVAIDLTPTSISQLQGAVIESVPSPGIPYSTYLNWEHGVFKDKLVRQAFEYGINIEPAVAAAFGGQYERAWSILSPSTANSYDASLEGSWPYDEAKANALLDQAGWTERDAEGFRVKDGERLSAEWLSWLPFSDENQALVNFFVDDLKKIGFELKHSAIEGPEYQARYADGDGNMILDFDLTDWGFSMLDADALRNHLHSQGYQNASNVKVSEIDGVLEEASTTTDLTERAKLYAQVQQWNVEEVGIVPIYLTQFTSAALPSVQGLAYDPYGWPLFAGVSLK